MTGSKAMRRWTVALVAVVMATATACSTGTQTASDQPTPTESTTAPTSSATGAGSPTETMTEAPPTTGIVKNGDGWSTYTNAELGFTFRFPTRMYASLGAPCVKEQESGGWSYRPAAGVVATTVIHDGIDFWVVNRVSYQLTDPVKMPDMTTKYKGCTRKVTTASMVRAYETGHSEYSLDVLPITVSRATTRTEVRDGMVAAFSGCATLTLASVKASTSGPWREVLVACPGDPMFPGGMYEVRWYRHAGLLVTFWFGQAIHIYDRGQHPADNKIAASFALLP